MKERRVTLILALVSALFMIGYCLFPVLYMVSVSLSKHPDFLSDQISFQFTLENYQAVLTGESLHFLDYLVNSLIISFTSALAAVIFASLAAYAFTRLKMPFKMGILFFVLAVSMFPQISLIGYLFKFMSRLGWINTYPALILPYIAWILPLSVWILVSYFSQIPKELDQAALIDGCSRWQVLCKVIFPVAKPGIFSVLLLSFILAFNEFMFALMLATDHQARTVPVGIALFQGLHGQTPWGNIMAASAIATVPVVMLAIIFQRQIISGLTRGAVKG